VDQYGQVIDVMLSKQRDTAAARRFFTCALRYGPAPVEATTDQAGPYLRVIDELVPAAAVSSPWPCDQIFLRTRHMSGHAGCNRPEQGR